MRLIKNPWIGLEGYNCFGCCPTNPYGVKMRFYEDGQDVVCFWKPQERYQSWIDTLHGGIQSVLLDEVCGWAVFSMADLRVSSPCPFPALVSTTGTFRRWESSSP